MELYFIRLFKDNPYFWGAGDLDVSFKFKFKHVVACFIVTQKSNLEIKSCQIVD